MFIHQVDGRESFPRGSEADMETYSELLQGQVAKPGFRFTAILSLLGLPQRSSRADRALHHNTGKGAYHGMQPCAFW